jgi:hypothetical protein
MVADGSCVFVPAGSGWCGPGQPYPLVDSAGQPKTLTPAQLSDVSARSAGTPIWSRPTTPPGAPLAAITGRSMASSGLSHSPWRYPRQNGPRPADRSGALVGLALRLIGAFAELSHAIRPRLGIADRHV